MNCQRKTPAMNFKAENYNGTRLPIDSDHNYIYLHPPTTSNNQPDEINGIFVLAALVVLIAVTLVLFVICVYQGTCLSGRINISWRSRLSFERDDPLSLCNVGLDACVIESLPVFEYKAQNFKEALECAVCLSEFEENEKARLLPNCKHSFHADCIDIWFRSHSTCPICRTGAQPNQRVDNNKPGEICMNFELFSSGNGQIRIGPELEQGETSYQGAKSTLDEGPSTSGICSIPEIAIGMPKNPESFSGEKQVCLHSGSQPSKTALHSLKRMLSRGGEGRVFPNALQDHGIETDGQPQS